MNFDQNKNFPTKMQGQFVKATKKLRDLSFWKKVKKIVSSLRSVKYLDGAFLAIS